MLVRTLDSALGLRSWAADMLLGCLDIVVERRNESRACSRWEEKVEGFRLSSSAASRGMDD